jgi:hypothetical protein
MLAPMGIRYLAVPSTQGTGGGAVAPAPRGLRTALGAQLDLARLRSGSGIDLYENLAWIPLKSVVPADAAASIPVGSNDPTRAALGVSVQARPVGGAAVPAGTLLWGEAYDGHWVASGSGGDLRHVEAFGWSNGYRVPRATGVDLAFDAQWQRWALLAVALLIWCAVAWRWWRTRVRRTRRPRDVRAAERRREERHDPLTDVLDEDKLWWERV